MSKWHKTTVIGDKDDSMIHSEYTLSLKHKDDQFSVYSNEQTFCMTLDNGLIGNEREVFYQLEISKASPFYSKFKELMKKTLDEWEW